MKNGLKAKSTGRVSSSAREQAGVVRKSWKTILSLALTIALLVFAYLYISDLVQKADFGSVSINPLLVVGSALLFALSYRLLSFHWLLSCRIPKPMATRRQSLAFFASQPYKYLPTSLFTFSSRAVFAKKLGLTFKQSSIAQLFENSSMLAANFGLFAVLYVARFDIWYALVLMLLMVLALFGFGRIKIIHLKFKKRRLDVVPTHLVKMYYLATAAWTLVGLSFVALNAALGLPVHLLDFLAANTIAFSLGLLAFFAPGGIGVREFVYNFFGVNPAAIIFWRIMTFVLDFVLGTAAILLIRIKQKEVS